MKKIMSGMLTKKEWKEYYTYLLNHGYTMQQLREKYENYEKKRDEWANTTDKVFYKTYLNAQAAFLEILNGQKK